MFPGGRCTLCVIQRKGKCGTDSAPKRCLKRLADGSAPKSSPGVPNPQDPPDTEDESSHHPAAASGAGTPASGEHANGGGDGGQAAMEGGQGSMGGGYESVDSQFADEEPEEQAEAGRN